MRARIVDEIPGCAEVVVWPANGVHDYRLGMQPHVGAF